LAGDAFLDAARCLLPIETMPWPTFHCSLTAPPGYIAPSLDLAVWLHEPANGAEWLLVDALPTRELAALSMGAGAYGLKTAA
jgi:acyl-CoA thioesterase